MLKGDQRRALERRAAAHRMAARGTGATEIGRVLGTSADVIRRWLRMPKPDVTPPAKPDMSWQDKAECRSVGGDMWFAEKSELSTIREAKRICRTSCEVQAQCLAYALEFDEPFGMWGGLTANERRDLRRGRTA
jgi:WhiB family redox-sensing transcriptional regulator